MRNKFIKVAVLIFIIFGAACQNSVNQIEQTERVWFEGKSIDRLFLDEEFFYPIIENEFYSSIVEDEFYRPIVEDNLCVLIADNIMETCEPILKELEKAGVSSDNNRIIIYECCFFKTETGCYIVKGYGHVQGTTAHVYEIYYLDENGYERILQSENVFIHGICDGEKLYFMVSDGSVWRIDKNGEVKTYLVFENENEFDVNFSYIEGNGDEIIIVPWGDITHIDAVVINLGE